MNKWLELLIGLILVVVPIYLAFSPSMLPGWGASAIEFLKGGLFWGIVGIGALFVLLGISDIKG